MTDRVTRYIDAAEIAAYREAGWTVSAYNGPVWLAMAQQGAVIPERRGGGSASMPGDIRQEPSAGMRAAGSDAPRCGGRKAIR